MNIEKFKLDHDTSYDSIKEGFFGYCIDDEVFHYKSSIPDLEKLFDNIANNCGVFCAIKKSNGIVTIFTDPLAQYPVFTYIKEDAFCISNDFFDTASYTSKSLNKEAIFDCLTYYSPLMNQTIVNECNTTKPFSYIQVDYNYDKPKITEFQIGVPETDLGYHELLEVISERFVNRAKAILKNHKPVVHLTGGLDSRLALSAILKASSSNNDFSVFCFGNGNNQDKLVFNYICDKFDLRKGKITLNGSNLNSKHHLSESSRNFSGLKFTNQTNYISQWNPSHSEVTGYFSKGLLKGFGNYYYDGSFNPFRYQSSISSLPNFIFNSSAFRMLSTMSDGKRLNKLTLDNYLCLSSRSKYYFGSHSAVNNKSFHSLDIIYDPMLINLYNCCPYDSNTKRQGAIIIDIICKIYGENLALLPLSEKFVNSYRNNFNHIPILNCFKKHSFPIDTDDNALEAYTSRISTEEGNVYYNNYDELFEIVDLKPEHLDFLSTLIDYSEDRVEVESSVIRSLIGYLSELTRYS